MGEGNNLAMIKGNPIPSVSLLLPIANAKRKKIANLAVLCAS